MNNRDRMAAADGWGITCRCGYQDVHEVFETYDEPDHYQCPECGIEWMILWSEDGDKVLWIRQEEDHF